MWGAELAGALAPQLLEDEVRASGVCVLVCCVHRICAGANLNANTSTTVHAFVSLGTKQDVPSHAHLIACFLAFLLYTPQVFGCDSTEGRAFRSRVGCGPLSPKVVHLVKLLTEAKVRVCVCACVLLCVCTRAFVCVCLGLRGWLVWWLVCGFMGWGCALAIGGGPWWPVWPCVVAHWCGPGVQHDCVP